MIKVKNKTTDIVALIAWTFLYKMIELFLIFAWIDYFSCEEPTHSEIESAEHPHKEKN